MIKNNLQIFGLFGLIFSFLFLFIINNSEIVVAEECNKPVTRGGICIFEDISANNTYLLGGASVNRTNDFTDRNTCFIGYKANSADCGPNPTDNLCGDGMCPLTGGGRYHGENCFIDADSDNKGIRCSGDNSVSGKWDENQDACITCNGFKESGRLAWGIDNFYCNGDTNGPLVNTFNLVCGADPLCDGKDIWNNCGISGKCDKNGQCCESPSTVNLSGDCVVPTSALSVDISFGTNPVSLNGTSVVTFRVKNNAIVESGVAIAVDSVSCGVLPNPVALTNGSGETTATFTAPSVAGICTIDVTASKAPMANVSSSISIAVTSCSSPNYLQYDTYRYIKGDSIKIEGLNPDENNNFSLCIYNPFGQLKQSNAFNSSFPQNITFISDGLGAWKGLAISGTGGCPASFNASQGCTAVADVIECNSSDSTNCGLLSCDLSTYTCDTSVVTCSDSMQYISGTVYCGGVAVNSGTVSISGCGCSYTDSIVPGDGGNYALLRSNIGGDTCTITASSSNPCCNVENRNYTVVTNINGNEDFYLTSLCTTGPIITPPRCDPNSGVYCNPLDEVNTLSKAAETFLGYVLGLIGSVALLFLIIAGVMYMTSAGSEEKIATSKRILTGAIIGLGIALLAYSLLKVIVDILNAP